MGEASTKVQSKIPMNLSQVKTQLLSSNVRTFWGAKGFASEHLLGHLWMNRGCGVGYTILASKYFRHFSKILLPKKWSTRAKYQSYLLISSIGALLEFEWGKYFHHLFPFWNLFWLEICSLSRYFGFTYVVALASISNLFSPTAPPG